MADPAASPYFLGVLVVSAFALPLVFLWWIRNTERYGREPIGAVLKAFSWGAVFSVLIALVVSVFLLLSLERIVPLYVFLSERFEDPETVAGVLIVAPFVEEASKALSARAGKGRARFPSDGLVYGAAAGLGFSATENLFYGLAALADPELGASASLFVIAVRSFSSSFLHASSTATTGYGLAKGWLLGRRWAFLPFYLVAVAMHSTFNFLTSFGQLQSAYGAWGDWFGFVAAVAFAITAITIVRLKLASRKTVVSR